MIKELISRLNPKAFELVKFIIVGGVATLTYLLVFLLLNYMSPLPLAINSILAYTLGMVVSYYGQSRFTFNNENDGASEIYRYLITALIGVAISVILMDFGVERGQIPLGLGLIGVCVLVPLMSFALMKLWVFREN